MSQKKQAWSPRDFPEPKKGGQPIWEFIGQLVGDEDPLERGAVFIYRDRTGVYEEEVQFLTPMIDGTFHVYRFPIGRLRLVDGYLVSRRYRAFWPHPLERYDEWFHRDLGEVASSIGTSKEDLERRFTVENPLQRASAYEAVAEHFGWENFDSYPLRLTLAEVKKRFRKELK